MRISDHTTRLPASATAMLTPWTQPHHVDAQDRTPEPRTAIHSHQVLRLTGYARS
jgi:hypothetical protein